MFPKTRAVRTALLQFLKNANLLLLFPAMLTEFGGDPTNY